MGFTPFLADMPIGLPTTDNPPVSPDAWDIIRNNSTASDTDFMAEMAGSVVQMEDDALFMGSAQWTDAQRLAMGFHAKQTAPREPETGDRATTLRKHALELATQYLTSRSYHVPPDDFITLAIAFEDYLKG